MSRLLIRGGNRLQGEVTIQGAKNSVLPILAATILTGGSVELRRCPRLRDVEASIRILQALGCKAGWRGDVLEVDTAGMTGCDVPDALMREMRSSVIFLGAILARCGEASLTSPGGCELGPRPIDLHLSALRQMGAQIFCHPFFAPRHAVQGTKLLQHFQLFGQFHPVLPPICSGCPPSALHRRQSALRYRPHPEPR